MKRKKLTRTFHTTLITGKLLYLNEKGEACTKPLELIEVDGEITDTEYAINLVRRANKNLNGAITVESVKVTHRAFSMDIEKFKEMADLDSISEDEYYNEEGRLEKCNSVIHTTGNKEDE